MKMERSSMIMTSIALIMGIFYVAPTFGLDSSLMFDIESMKKSNAASYFAPPKAKKAQEEVMFGNQQNKLTDNHNFGRPAKRAFSVQDLQNVVNKEDNDESGSYGPIQLPLVYQPRYRNTYYYDPSLYEVPYFEEVRDKRNTQIQKNKHLAKREIGGSKRELRVDPQELLALLALWEAEQSRKHTAEPKQFASRYDEYGPSINEEENEIDTNENINDEGIWLDGQTVPTHRIKPRYFPPYHWAPTMNQQAKRYLKEIMMKRNSKEE